MDWTGTIYVAAASVMSDRIEYSIDDRELSGPEAVTAAYRAASHLAHRLFDRVEYGHHVIPTDDPYTFRISYTDALTVADEILIHMEQHVTVAPGEGVVRIVNVDIPGEKEKVDVFMDRHSLTREP